MKVGAIDCYRHVENAAANVAEYQSANELNRIVYCWVSGPLQKVELQKGRRQ